MWMDLEIIILNEVRPRKTNVYTIPLICGQTHNFLCISYLFNHLTNPLQAANYLL